MNPTCRTMLGSAAVASARALPLRSAFAQKAEFSYKYATFTRGLPPMF